MSLMIFFRSESARRACVRLSVLSVVVSTIFHFLFYNDVFFSLFVHSLWAVGQKKKNFQTFLLCISQSPYILGVDGTTGRSGSSGSSSVLSSPFMVWLFCFFVFSTWFIIIFPRFVSPHFPLSRRYFMRRECSYFTCLWALRLTILIFRRVCVWEREDEYILYTWHKYDFVEDFFSRSLRWRRHRSMGFTCVHNLSNGMRSKDRR